VAWTVKGQAPLRRRPAAARVRTRQRASRPNCNALPLRLLVGQSTLDVAIKLLDTLREC
jgi:hypothetical protein